MSVLVDSSVWIAAQNPRNKECLQLKRLLKSEAEIACIRPIQAEVCQGARSPEAFHRMWDSMLAFRFFEVTDRIWGKSAWNFFLCRKNGITPTTLDCLVATVAREHSLKLWSLDRDFKGMRRIIEFGSYEF
ncbi:MAG: PIN domain nuclease [Deltaproteobacteria bacterium]|nr:PIN domain nuclease [Deltaproteobacteria bacterium]